MSFLPHSLLAVAASAGRFATGLSSLRHAYQRMRPVTAKNIGRNHFKQGSGRYMPHQGEREIARRRRQLAAGQIRFIAHGPIARSARARPGVPSEPRSGGKRKTKP